VLFFLFFLENDLVCLVWWVEVEFVGALCVSFVGCGVVEGRGCWNYKLNLIEYVKYKNRPGLLKECPDEMILNKMPSAGYSKVPRSYYIKDGVRKEIQEYDDEWLRANCTIPVQEVY
jgi:hypothetical protein